MISFKMNPKILIVDDNTTNLKVVMAYLRAYSFEIHVARNGLEGLESAELSQPDLILLDVQMPQLDGFETCKRLKANSALKEIPVIFMTALTDASDKVRGFEVGAVDYVTKPIEEKELLARVQTHLTLRNLQVRLEERVKERTDALESEVEKRRKSEAEKEELLVVVRSQSEQLHSLTQQMIQSHPLQTIDLENSPLVKLSTREYEVFQLIAQGKPNAEIAEILTVSAGTVSTYRNRIVNKLGLEDAAALQKYILEQRFK